MQARSIVIEHHVISEQGFEALQQSSKQVGNDFEIERFAAFDDVMAHRFMSDLMNGVRWTYPWEGETFDIPSGMTLRAYPTRRPLARVGCFLSHYHLWRECAEANEPFLILEHDAIFLRKLDVDALPPLKDIAISLNDPRGATRKSGLFHEKLQQSNKAFVPCPWIDPDDYVPQGLPGNSAYIIGPEIAKKAVETVKMKGAWPNDALLCNQLFPKSLFCARDYVTGLQDLPSTTTR